MEIKVYTSDASYYLENEELVDTIDRKPFNKGFVGNFIPHWARYKNQEYLIQGSIDYAYMHGFNNDAHIIIS